jgi:hypothetical protein
MSTPPCTEPVMLQDNPKIQVARAQLREALRAGGVFHDDIVAAKIEMMVMAHFLHLIENGMRVERHDDN